MSGPNIAMLSCFMRFSSEKVGFAEDVGILMRGHSGNRLFPLDGIVFRDAAFGRLALFAIAHKLGALVLMKITALPALFCLRMQR